MIPASEPGKLFHPFLRVGVDAVYCQAGTHELLFLAKPDAGRNSSNLPKSRRYPNRNRRISRNSASFAIFPASNTRLFPTANCVDAPCRA